MDATKKQLWKDCAAVLNSRNRTDVIVLDCVPEFINESSSLMKYITTDWGGIVFQFRVLIQNSAPNNNHVDQNLRFGKEKFKLGNQKYKCISLHSLIMNYLL